MAISHPWLDSENVQKITSYSHQSLSVKEEMLMRRNEAPLLELSLSYVHTLPNVVLFVHL